MLRIAFHREAAPGLPRLLPLHPGAPHAHESRAYAAGFTGALGEAASMLPDGPVLVGLGPAAAGSGSERQWMEAGGQAVLALQRARPGARHAVLDARGLEPGLAAALAAGAALRSWRFDALRHPAPEEEAGEFPALKALDILADDPALALQAWEAQEPAIRGTLLARDLVAEPGNRLNPREFARRLEALAAEGLQVEVWRRKDLARAGFGALLAVGEGSATPPRLVVLRWPGEPGTAPVVFVGKGITFDTGGISIKPAAGMEEMRADMAGAAACAGAMLALAARGSRTPAAAVLALAENAVGAASFRPGDMVRTLSGRTVEVVDTDAEGRMVLADALTHAVSALRPRAVIDLATLTGSIVTALGHHRAGLFGNDDTLRDAVLAAGEAVGEPLWPMPIGAAHREDLRSDIADLRQCWPGGTGRRGIPDACHAAAFLREFVGAEADAPNGATPWAHLDIAGVESREEDGPLGPRGPSGYGVRLLDRLVRDHFEPRRRRRG
ncbi:leucyl aminopeptidase family protein [Roseomonas gilardii]|uniref:Leucyl aminopeptidase family protein n=1 Tax=Roseomonas gilardii TaxID=257708 RepID=A0ABU3MF64_9PROT|nr:leucyl aminopeptidase family protein [Roseomonas gilardii]MDT8331611.1 leucyl aminopeptidase family protein [Roseomonas gilardii]